MRIQIKAYKTYRKRHLRFKMSIKIHVPVIKTAMDVLISNHRTHSTVVPINESDALNVLIRFESPEKRPMASVMQ